jgi:nucleotide-binding universal stress UspA family protein
VTDTDMLDELQAADSKVVQECLAPVERDIAVECRSVGTRAQWALEEAAIGADLLVVGCHRSDDHWFSRLGPVASWLLHRSPCPVAVVGRPRRGATASQPSQASEMGRQQPGARSSAT